MDNNSRQSVDLRWRLRKALEKAVAEISKQADMERCADGKCRLMVFLNDSSGINPMAFGTVAKTGDLTYSVIGYGIDSLGNPKQGPTVAFDGSTGKTTIS